jgi:UDP-N-acetylmuramoyl-tripeptide--D-alanyl-D-alanine ligase
MILLLVFAFTFVVAAFVSSLTCVHMLQLSSYQTPSYWAWFKRGASDYYIRQWPLLIVVTLGLWENNYALVCACLAFGLIIGFNFPKKAKKPLVFTPRVMRLLAVQLLLLVLLGSVIVLANFPHNLNMVWVSASFMLIPFLTMISNFITMPVQKLINNSFIRDAKRILNGMPDLKIVGITGSYGKTSVKFILARLLSVKYETLNTPDSYNTPMGVVRTIREQLKPTHEYFICEMGARHVGDIKEICDIVSPRFGMLTAIGEQHMDTFKTLANVTKTKWEIVDAAKEKAFINVDSTPVREHARPDYCVTYGLDHIADYTATNLSVDSKGSAFTVSAPNGENADFTAPLLGRHSVLNILGAIAVAHNIGIPLSQLAEPVSRLPQVKHRLELLKGEHFTIIDDAFNANPVGVKVALDTLKMFDGFKVVITPGMVELGDRQTELNRIYGTQLAEVCGHVILVGKKQTEPIVQGLNDADYSKFTVVDKFEEAMRHAVELKADVVLLANDLPDNY